MNFSLIVPIAANNSEYITEIPALFRLGNQGFSTCVKAISGLDLNLFDNIYFSILRQHDEKFRITDLLMLQFRRLGLNNAKVVVLKDPTISEADTIYRTIEQENIKGALFVKDADCSFEGEIIQQNGVAIYPLDKLHLVDPQRKSYVVVDDGFFITNIIEKRVVSHYFNAGGYAFEDAEEFKKYYEAFQKKNGLCMSHIIYKMLLNKMIFRPVLVKEYRDYNLHE